MGDSESLFSSVAAATANEASQKSRRTAKSAVKLLESRNLSLTGDDRAKVLRRVEEMPVSCRNTYLRALKGRSRQTAIRAFCQMCVGWQHRGDVKDCADPACPLYPYRPFR